MKALQLPQQQHQQSRRKFSASRASMSKAVLSRHSLSPFTYLWAMVLILGHLSFLPSSHGLTTNPRNTRKNHATQALIKQGRRSFFTQTLSIFTATAFTTGLIMAPSPEPVQAAMIKTPNEMVAEMKRDKTVYDSYEQFRQWLATDQLLAVQFGKDGTSLACVDVKGQTHQIRNMPDDKRLLKDLYEHRVTVTVEQYVFPKYMNAGDWFKDLVGIENTDEDPTIYRGYKTYRQNIPERAYVPSNILTGYDMSRNMYKGKK